ncbi:MAG: hypothetical protein JXR15_21010 [Shimia sp.]|uniref:hypothetical protein n=1 Tax=Shimia sp. TaxID=1954381 RepID=UPI003B8BA5A6
MFRLAIIRAEHMTAEGNSICFTITYRSEEFSLSGVNFSFAGLPKADRMKDGPEGELVLPIPAALASQSYDRSRPFLPLEQHLPNDGFQPFQDIGERCNSDHTAGSTFYDQVSESRR